MPYFTTGAQLQAAIDALPTTKKGNFTPFDAFFYGNQYMGAYSGTLSPLDHFVQIGAARGYSPTAQFDASYYKNAYADLRGTNLDSADLLFHFLQFGLDEGRAPNATLAGFNATQYLANNPDVAEYINENLDAFGGSASNGALAHFVKFGQFEGRTAENTTAGAEFRLTEGSDFGSSFTGTNNADVFKANVVQNALGAQVNTLGSGDELNGGGGTDTLNAKVTAGAFINGSYSMPIQPETNSIEIIKLQAVNSDIDESVTNVYVNAKDMLGVTKIGSNYSDANLVIQNLTTKDNAGNARNVSEMTIGMEYTGNADSHWDESDLSVYFDQDYLTPSITRSEPIIELRVMNEDAYDETNGAEPLAGVYIAKMAFTLNGASYDLADFITEDPAGAGEEIVDYADLLEAVQGAIVALKAANPGNAALQSLKAELGAPFRSDINPNTLEWRQGDSIRLSVDGLTGGAANVLTVSQTDLTLNRAGAATVENNNRYERAAPYEPETGERLNIKVDLEKVGLAGDGGELVIGSMNKTSSNTWGAKNSTTDTKSGIEEFNVTVRGTNDKSSSLAGLHSTNNNLRVVTVATDAALTGTSFADLTIGNSNTDALLGALPSLNNRFALKDVQTFDASAFKGDLSLHAALTREVTAKYMNLVDQAPAAASADNVEFEYTGGTGNDYFNIALDVANLASAGTATREDFNLNVEGGAGNDAITLGLVNSNGAAFGIDNPGALSQGGANGYANWYDNQKLNANLRIDGGDGDDTIWTPGSGDVVILGGAGNDTIYTDNTAAKAVWAFNVMQGGAPSRYNLNDLQSDANDSYRLYKTQVSVNFKGIEVKALIPTTNGVASDLAINQAIKKAINSDAVLSKLLVATDGPANTLVVTSLIDGVMDNAALNNDLSISFVAPTVALPTDTDTTTKLSLGDVAQLAAWYGVAGDAAAFQALIAAQVVAVGTKGDYASNFARAFGSEIDGDASFHVTDNTITGGTGNDVVVLATGAYSNETVVYNAANFGNDTIVNFDSTINPPGSWNSSSYEVFTAEFVDSDGSPVAQTIVFDGVTVNLSAPTLQGVIPVEDIVSQFVAQYNAVASANWVAVANVPAGTIQFTHKTPGAVTDVAAADFTGTYFGAANGNGSVTITVDTDAVDNAVTGTPSTFTVTYDAATTAVTAAGAGVDIAFAGETITLAQGDGSVTVADKVAAGTYTGWTAAVTHYATYSTVTFTATSNAATAIGTAADFKVDAASNADGVTGSLTGTVGVANSTTPPTQVPAGPGTGIDKLDFTGLGGSGLQFAGAAISEINKSITVVGQTAANDTAAEIAALYTNDSNTETKHIYIAVDAHNKGYVYQVVDAAGIVPTTGNTTATLVGTIDLADTPWATLTAVNFVA